MIKSIIEVATYSKLILFKLLNGYFLVIAMAFLAATDGIDWGALTATQKVRLIIFCVVAGGKYLEGFFDQSLSRAKEGKPLLPTGETDFLTKVKTV